MPASRPADEGGPVTTLRGAGVDVDARRIGRVLLGVVAVGVAVAAVVLVVSGLHRNDQVDRLRHHGVPVAFRITACIGEMGGSGSNLVGYRCSGTYRLGGRSHHVGLPGDGFRPVGSTVAAVAVPGRPSLVEAAASVARDRTSYSFLVLPLVLLAADASLVTGVVVRRRREAQRRRGGV